MKRFVKLSVVSLYCLGSFSSAQDFGWVAIGPLEGSAKNIRQLSLKLDNKMTLYAVTGAGILRYLGNDYGK
jgi:hypothetical protein